MAELRVFEGDETEPSRVAMLNKALPAFKEGLEELLEKDSFESLNFRYRLDLQAEYAYPVMAIAVVTPTNSFPIDVQVYKRAQWEAVIGSQGKTVQSEICGAADVVMLCEGVRVAIAPTPEIPIAEVLTSVEPTSDPDAALIPLKKPKRDA
jgi:UDP-glucose 6-dehydrogenase